MGIGSTRWDSRWASDQPPGITGVDFNQEMRLAAVELIYTSDCIFTPDTAHPQSTPPASQPWKGTSLYECLVKLTKINIR